jgi:hypothetical protein
LPLAIGSLMRGVNAFFVRHTVRVSQGGGELKQAGFASRSLRPYDLVVTGRNLQLIDSYVLLLRYNRYNIYTRIRR